MDWGKGLGIGIEDWDRGVGLGIGIGDWEIGIGDCGWGLVLGIWIWD